MIDVLSVAIGAVIGTIMAVAGAWVLWVVRVR